MAELGRNDPVGRARALEWRDKEGRTPLLLAAAKNYYQTARLLLQNGADVLFVNNTGRGNVLHEAAHYGHEAMVELQLQQGAQPFMVNASGRTPIEEAIAAGNTNIVRRLEREALFAGSVSVKTSTLAGFSHAYKPRWVVVMHRFPNPTDSEPQLRKVLWVYSDQTALNPKTKVWLDGASAYHESTDGTDLVVRLHATHPEPDNVYSRYDRGYCLFMRPVSQTPAALDTCHHLMVQCNPSAMPVVVSLSSAAVVAPGVQRFSGPPPGQVGGQAVPPAHYPRLPSIPAGSSASMQASGVGAVGWAQPAPQSLQSQSMPQVAGVMPPWGGGQAQLLTPELTALAMAATRQPPPGAARGGAACGMDVMQALPGESDQQFAARLAGGSAGAAHSQERTSPAGGQWGPSSSSSTAPAPVWPPAGAPPSPRKVETPSAPPAPGMSAPAAAPPAPSDDNICVICLSEERKSGFLHGSTVHACACASCAAMFRVGAPCPMCRAPVERVLGVY